MIQKLINILSKRDVVIVSFAGTVLFVVAITAIDSKITSNDLGIVYLQLAFSKMNFEAILASWGTAGISLFINTIWVHFIYPLCYSILLASTPFFLIKRMTNADSFEITGTEKMMFFIPFAAALFDYINNIMIVMILSLKIYSDNIIFICSSAALIKWFFIMASLFMILKKYFSIRKNN